jgi:hypothetical protein
MVWSTQGEQQVTDSGRVDRGVRVQQAGVLTGTMPWWATVADSVPRGSLGLRMNQSATSLPLLVPVSSSA